ncbi:MAG: hypothetical protein MUC45_08825 [Actinomycetia bacterium]|nr:hypothetical protein [Actinomycetes bacterium]
MTGAAMVACAWCGAAPPGDATVPPLTWTSSVEGGRQAWYCERCSRVHLRAIEGRLDAEWF